MNHTHIKGLLSGLALACTSGTALAQNATPAATAPLNRKQVRMDTAERLKTHRCDEGTGEWLGNPPAKMK
jgi:hypothetical protein